MSFLDELRRSRESPASAYQLFLLQSPKSRDGVHAFFEGHDDSSFYYGFLAHYAPAPRTIYVYRCGNKEGVYETYAKVTRSARPTATLLFFVDKDYSDLLGERHPTAANIFVTEYYSIENYLVSEEMLRRVWEDIFSFTNVHFGFDGILARFRSELNRFYAFALPLTAWIIFLRQNGLRPNLNDLNLSRVCSFNNEIALELAEMEKVIEISEPLCGVKTPGDFASAAPAILVQLSALEPKKYIRGKFELWFFVRFVAKLAETLRNTILDGRQSVKLRTSIGEENAVEVLGPRAVMPSGLKFFLEQQVDPNKLLVTSVSSSS